MKIKTAALLLIFTMIFLTFPAVHAQLSVRIQLGQTNYLEYDPVFIQVSIRNNSAHAVAFGNLAELKGGLKFEIRHENGKNRRYLPLIDPKTAPPLTGIIIPPGAMMPLRYMHSPSEVCHLSDIKYAINLLATFLCTVNGATNLNPFVE